MDFKKIIAVVLLVLGVILVIYGFNQLNSLESQVTRALGQNDTNAISSIVIGGISAVLGLVFILKKK